MGAVGGARLSREGVRRVEPGVCALTTSPSGHSAKVRHDIARGASVVEQLVAQVVESLGPALLEHPFHEARRWRFDAAWPSWMLALEVEGGAFVGGAHGRGAHFRQDAEKYNEAAARGWRVIRVLPEHVQGGQAAYWLRRAAGLPVEPRAWARVQGRKRATWKLRRATEPSNAL